MKVRSASEEEDDGVGKTPSGRVYNSRPSRRRGRPGSLWASFQSLLRPPFLLVHLVLQTSPLLGRLLPHVDLPAAGWRRPSRIREGVEQSQYESLDRTVRSPKDGTHVAMGTAMLA